MTSPREAVHRGSKPGGGTTGRAGPLAIVAGLAVAMTVAIGALVFAGPGDRTAAAGDEADAWSHENLVKQFPPPDAKAPEDDFVGNGECKECHEDRVKTLGTSFHAAMRSEKKSNSKGCEACHGPGREHTDSAGEEPIRNPAKATADKTIAVCITCHAEVLEKPSHGHRAWIHAKGTDLRSCTTCHSVHIDKSLPAFDEKTGPFHDRKSLNAVAQPVSPKLCATCHTTFHPDMARSGHAHLLREDPGCAACHGNASLHAQSGGREELIIDPDHLSAKEADATCNECHAKADVKARWTCAEHSREKVTCITCHDANAAKGHTLRGSEFELCGGCHKDIQAKFRMPNRHRVAEGRVACSDCHDPHGNTSKLRDLDLRLRVCGECHSEKTQPFLFDHGIKQSEGCIACHDPHGSTNRRMLTHSTMRPLCLQCHPETPHDMSKRKYDNCIACHSEIHGSDFDKAMRR